MIGESQAAVVGVSWMGQHQLTTRPRSDPFHGVDVRLRSSPTLCVHGNLANLSPAATVKTTSMSSVMPNFGNSTPTSTNHLALRMSLGSYKLIPVAVFAHDRDILLQKASRWRPSSIAKMTCRETWNQRATLCMLEASGMCLQKKVSRFRVLCLNIDPQEGCNKEYEEGTDLGCVW